MAWGEKESVCNAQRVYRIGGISVEFPYKAYASQLAFMGKVVATLERSHRRTSPNNEHFNNGGRCHALLESPTGTGKSLSLLCSTLAWLKNFKTSPPPQPCPPSTHDSGISHTATEPSRVAGEETGFVHDIPATAGGFVSDSFSSAGGFVPESFSSGGGFLREDIRDERSANANKQTPKKRKYPTIFYATRTHSQITQVLREYRKTRYRVPMAVLAARKHYCTNKHVCKKKNVDEECKLLLKDPDRSCLQFKNFHKVKNHSSLQKGGVHEIHDIEDLVGIGNTVKGCAYFASRSMALDAEIVFCPYVYLLNPVIRSAMEIDLQGAIIILDEAHNIEEVAREAGSIDLETTILEGIRMELEQLTALGTSVDFYHPLLDMVQEMLSWIYQKSNSLEKQDFERYSSCWSGDGALQELQLAGVHPQSFPILSECAKKAVGAAAEAEADTSHLSGFSAGMLESLFSVLHFMLKDNGRHLLDYRLVVQKYVKRDEELGVTGWVSSLSFWCLNPAVIFEEVASRAQSIILTSGTLSPLGSFATELGVTFDMCMEAPHVIDMKSQVWAAAIPKGLGNVPLNASYKHADGYAFQDALGSALENVFKVSPDGALVFFPSYKLLDKLCDRWKATGQWKRLYEEKQLFIEPRGKMETFEKMLTEYYRVINGGNKSKPKAKSRTGGGKKNAKEQEISACMTAGPSKSGAAFLAVCRGKVSEGIDFSDKNARIVIIVGIPFPNQKDLQVNMKKQYNTQNRVTKTLLSGDQWYCYQAFRALNQAVGRCIRHRHDYGAILLMDERYKRPSNLDYMSKWLRNSIQQVERLEDSLTGLQFFFQQFKDPLPPSFTTQEMKNSSCQSRQMPTNTCMTPTTTARTSSITDDVENQVLTHDVTTLALAKQRKRITEKQPNKDEGQERPILGVCRSPLQEIQPQMGRNLNHRLTQSGSDITTLDSPPLTASCKLGYSVKTFHEIADKVSFVKSCSLDNQQQPWTPSASTFSNSSIIDSSALHNKITLESSTSSCHKCELRTPCNHKNVCVLATTSAGSPNADPLVRSLSTDFMACKELDINDVGKHGGSPHDGLEADYSLSARKKPPIQQAVEIEKQRNTIPASVFCLKCGGSLLQVAGHGICWQKEIMQKKYLCNIIDPTKREGTACVDVLVCELCLLHPLVLHICSTDANNDEKSSSTAWVEEDGCVYKSLFCPWCKDGHCVGAHVVAADHANIPVLNKALLLCNAVTTSVEEGLEKGTQIQASQEADGKWSEPASIFSAKRASQIQTPPRLKLKLRRRE